MTTFQKNKKIESRINNALLTLIFSVIENGSVASLFIHRIHPILDRSTNALNHLTMIKQKYNTIYKTSNIKLYGEEVVDFINMIEKVNDKTAKLKNKVVNYQRYAEGAVYGMECTYCPICYCGEYIETKLICGHTICIDCMLTTLAISKKCPICNEYINVKKVAIIKDSVKNYYSNLLQYINKLDEFTILLTNFKLLTIKPNCQIININDKNVSNDIRKIKKVSKLVQLVNDADTSTFELYQVTDYLKMLFVNIQIVNLTFKL